MDRARYHISEAGNIIVLEIPASGGLLISVDAPGNYLVQNPTAGALHAEPKEIEFSYMDTPQSILNRIKEIEGK